MEGQLRSPVSWLGKDEKEETEETRSLEWNLFRRSPYTRANNC